MLNQRIEMNIMSQIKVRSQQTAGVFIILLTIIQAFPCGIHVFELWGSFAHFTLIFAVLAVIFSLILQWRVLLIYAIACFCISGTLIFPHFASTIGAGSEDFKIGEFNLYHGNPTPEAAIETLRNANVDVFTIQELNADWNSMMDAAFEENYPFKVVDPWGQCCYGIGLYSKFPILTYEIVVLGRTPAIKAIIDIRGRHTMVISLHTRPPIAPNETPERNEQLEKVAEMAAESEIPCIVLGDFNIVPWDGKFKDFLKIGNLKAVRDGFQATYPMDLGVPLIPIDHITYSGNLIPTSCEAVTIPGSDHRGLVVGFAFED
ncbi:MAG: hypothetical protein GC178_10170 [Flavobacteriales bacterium]|nr:hypothetical protein [Flavobacteriales bacterium]